MVRLPVKGEPCNREGIYSQAGDSGGRESCRSNDKCSSGICDNYRCEHEQRGCRESRARTGSDCNFTDGQSPERDGNGRNSDRAEEVMKRLRLEHLNDKERKQVEKTCAAYQDIFHLRTKR